MSGIASMIGSAPGSLAGVTAVTTSVLAFALKRRRRRRPGHRAGIRRHDGSGRVWEFEYEAGHGRDFLFAAASPDLRAGADVLENPPPATVGAPARHGVD